MTCDSPNNAHSDKSGDKGPPVPPKFRNRLQYYEALSLPKNATPEDIRRSYLRLALKWHPDKNINRPAEAEKRFKEITEAYEVLSDGVKRAQYDRLGDLFNTVPPKHVFRSPTEVFREIFGDDVKLVVNNIAKTYDGAFFSPFHDPKENNGLFNPEKKPQFADLKNAWPFCHRPFPPTATPQRRKCKNLTITATKFVDGSTVITKRYSENGCEIVEHFEGNQLLARQVDGVAQPIEQCA